jgi:preprotein translocase subunit YajC
MISALAQSSTTQTGGSGVAFLLPLVLFGAILYFLMIRPQRKRMQSQQAVLASLHVGDEVMTAGGIIGRITHIDEEEDVLTVEIAPGTSVRMVRGGISRKLSGDDYDEDEDEGADETS